jgi:hypothetical protein
MSEISKKLYAFLNAKFNAKLKKSVDFAEVISTSAISRLFSSIFDESFQKTKVLTSVNLIRCLLTFGSIVLCISFIVLSTF